METILGAFIGVGGTVIGVLIAHHLSKKLIEATHRNALQLIQIGEFHRAASTFRVAFVNEIFLLQENVKEGNRTPDEIIDRKALIVHEKAKIIFESSVSNLEGFSKAWEQYKNTDRTYTPKNMGNFNREVSEAYLIHIENLLKYAK